MLSLNVIRRTMAFTATMYTVAIMLALAGNGSATGAAGHVTRTTTANVRHAAVSPVYTPRYHVTPITIVGIMPGNPSAVIVADSRIKASGPQMHCGAKVPLASDATAMVRYCRVY